MKRTNRIHRCYHAISPDVASRATMFSTAGSSGMPRHFREGMLALGQAFDYMGRTEFEGSSLGEGLRPLFLADQEDLSLRVLSVHPAQVTAEPHHHSNVARTMTQDIHYLCLTDQAIQVRERVLALAHNDRVTNDSIKLMEPIYLSEVLKFHNHRGGAFKVYTTWVELDNGFLFTTLPTVAQFLIDYFTPADRDVSSLPWRKDTADPT